ncbi:thioredoxin family protein [Saccharothrix violaceirubra]|uniref:Thiol-disulfide isomerase/thioredoxin n=1 Tax=Saccharothrix violaceirubra TaxID=413306 RepID=A0A7W7WTN2_9PSEU|nr:thioredoxin family protein [Saccharothrix violaceirubra]MBB4962658.1 thiol-disulfide isomerase/thioredoxin [Saccharothrix violaceirubra]
MSTTGLWALLGVVLVVAAIGVVKKVRDGRVRAARKTVDLPEPVRALLDADAAVTLVQLSTTFCAPCRHTRVLLADLAAKTPGLRHAELDVADRPEVATTLGVLRTPTTIAFDASGAELLRVGGVPRREALAEALRTHLG